MVTAYTDSQTITEISFICAGDANQHGGNYNELVLPQMRTS